MQLFLARCADTYGAGNGIIIPLVDEDLIQMLENLRQGMEKPGESILQDRLRGIALR